MISKRSNISNSFNVIKFGQYSFYIATFFLVTALPISVLFFLISFAIYLKYNYLDFLKNKFNQFFGICSIIMILSTINSVNNLSSFTNQTQINIVSGLFNWIPFFLLFTGFKFYLETIKQRLNFSKFLVLGSLPVVIGCILQYWFKVYGPFEFFNGLIVFFLYPHTGHEGVSSIFNNQNYNGMWLSITLPFIIFQVINNKYLILKISLFILLSLTIYFLLLTNSRNSLLSLLIIFLMILNKKKFILMITPLLALIFLFREIVINLLINISNQYNFFPIKTFERIFSIDINNSPRVEIYSLSSKLIFENPLLGWGTNTFKNVYKTYGGLYDAQHTHNIFLELAYNFGVPLAILLLIFFLVIIIKSILRVYKFPSSKLFFDFNKIWILCSLIIFVNYLNDITYYDGRISIFTWIIFAGSASIFNGKRKDLKISDL